MEETIETTPEAEVIAPTETTVETKETTPEPQQTISEMVEETQPEEKENMIPESVFLGEKKARKALEKEVKSLRQQIESGATQEEVSDSIAEIAEEHDIDKRFLQKLASTIKADTEKELEEKFSSKFQQDEKKEKFETVFNRAYETAMERAPEFKEIANPEVIKSLSLLPQNSKKTISQILEETYSNAIQGKRTIETTSPGGGKEPEPLDLSRAEKDIEYFKQVMSDPKKKAQYNEAMLQKGF